jgi:hypothetical protein
MMRLSAPAYSFDQVLDECSAGVGKRNLLLERLAKSRSKLLNEDIVYRAPRKIARPLDSDRI